MNISHRSWNAPASCQVMRMIQDSELTDVNSGEKLKMDVEHSTSHLTERKIILIHIFL